MREVGPPYDAIKFAQIDYWLSRESWKSAVSDVQSRMDIFFESDHFVLEAVIKILAQHPKKEVVEKTHRYDKPTPSQWTQYNEDIKSCLVDEVRFDLTILLAALQQSEEKNLDRTPPEKRKPYLTRQTWAKIQKRNRLRCNKAPETEVRKLQSWPRGTSRNL